MAHKDYQHIGKPQDKMVEEIGEVLKALGKCNRFGYFNYHPDRPTSCNIKELNDEIFDLNNTLVEVHNELIEIMEKEGVDFNVVN